MNNFKVSLIKTYHVSSEYMVEAENEDHALKLAKEIDADAGYRMDLFKLESEHEDCTGVEEMKGYNEEWVEEDQ